MTVNLGDGLPPLKYEVVSDKERPIEAKRLEAISEYCQTLLDDSPTYDVDALQSDLAIYKAEIAKLNKKMPSPSGFFGRVKQLWDPEGTEKRVAAYAEQLDFYNDTSVQLEDAKRQRKQINAKLDDAQGQLNQVNNSAVRIYRVTIAGKHFQNMREIENALSKADVEKTDKNTFEQTKQRILLAIGSLSDQMSGNDTDKANAKNQVLLTAAEVAVLCSALGTKPPKA